MSTQSIKYKLTEFEHSSSESERIKNEINARIKRHEEFIIDYTQRLKENLDFTELANEYLEKIRFREERIKEAKEILEYAVS